MEQAGGNEQCSITRVYRPVFLWLQPITWQLLSLATPPTLKGTLYESKMANIATLYLARPLRSATGKVISHSQSTIKVNQQ